MAVTNSNALYTNNLTGFIAVVLVIGQVGVSVSIRRQTLVKSVSFHSIRYLYGNVVDRGVLQAMWEELAGDVGHRYQLIII